LIQTKFAEPSTCKAAIGILTRAVLHFNQLWLPTSDGESIGSFQASDLFQFELLLCTVRASTICREKAIGLAHALNLINPGIDTMIMVMHKHIMQPVLYCLM
jgi:hypothetical protein